MPAWFAVFLCFARGSRTIDQHPIEIGLAPNEWSEDEQGKNLQRQKL
jgi:hypothetical protein